MTYTIDHPTYGDTHRLSYNDLERLAKATWLKYVRTHTLPADIPTRPDRVYGNEFKGWQDWLGWTP